MSSDESEMELNEPKEEVGEKGPLEEKLVGHESDPEDEDSEVQDFDSDSREKDDSSDPDYDPSRDH